MPERRGGRVIDLDETIEGTETMATELQHISAAVHILLHGRLTEDAVVILIHALLPKGQKLSHQQIKAVLRAAERLHTHVRPG